MRVIFSAKMFKIWFTFQTRKKNSQKACWFLDNSSWIGCVKLSLLTRQYLPSTVNALTDIPETLHITRRDFFRLSFTPKSSINMINVPLCRYQEHLRPFNIFLLEGSSETELFRHLSNHLFCSPYFRKYISYEGHLLFQHIKNLIWVSRMEKKIQNNFCVS